MNPLKLRRVRIIVSAFFAAAMICGSLPAAAEGLNATYARLANELAGSIQKAAGRNFSGQIKIQGITRDEMAAVLAEEMALARAERLGVADIQRRSQALSRVVPVRYSLARGRLYFVQEILRTRLESARLNAGSEQEAVRLLLAYELTRVLMDQYCDLKSRLAEAGTPVRSRALRANVEGCAHLIVEKLAIRRSHSELIPLAAGWPIGKGASAAAERDIAPALDEEFELCWSGGYRFAAYLADKHGMDAVYRACWNPPAELGLLYNPSGYKPQSGPTLGTRPNIAEKPGSSSATGSIRTGLLGPALLKVKGHLPQGSWYEQVQTEDEFFKNGTPEQVAQFKEIVEEWVGYKFISIDLGSVVGALLLRLKAEVTDSDLQERMIVVEKGLAQLDQEGMSYTPGNNLPLAGVGYGSGWLQLGTLSKDGDSIPCWILVARAGNYLIDMSGFNSSLTTGQATAIVNSVFDSLQ